MALGMPQTPTPPTTAADMARGGTLGRQLGGAASRAGAQAGEAWRANNNTPTPGLAGVPPYGPGAAAATGVYAPTPDIAVGSPNPSTAYNAAISARANAPGSTPMAPSIIAGQYDPRQQEIQRGMNTGYNAGQQAQSAAQAANDAYLAKLAAGGKALDASYAAQQEILKGQQDTSRERYDYNTGALRTNNGLSSQLLANGMYRDVNLNREENNTRWEAAQGLFGRQQDLLQKDWAYNQDQRGRAGSARDLASGYYNSVYGNAIDQANQKKLMSTDATRSASATHGSYASMGNARSYRDIGTNYDLSAKSAGDARDYNTGQANQQYDATVGGLQNSWNQRDAEFQNQVAANKAAADTTNRTNKYLDSVAADYGVKGQQLQQALNNGLANLGFDRDTAIAQISAAIASKDTDRIAAVNNLVQQAISVSGPTGSGLGSLGGGDNSSAPSLATFGSAPSPSSTGPRSRAF